MFDVKTLPVGSKHPPKVDARTLMLAQFLKKGELPPYPEECTRSVHPWGMYANDRVGDCVLAAAAHFIMASTHEAGKQFTPTVKAITTLYKHLSPDDGGLVLLDILNLWHHAGIDGHKIGGFTKLDRHNIVDHLKYSIFLFGGCFAGMELPLSAQDQVGAVWDVPAHGATGHGAKGSWGGHGIFYSAYDPDGFTIATWGKDQRATNAFVKTYGDEEYGLLTADWATAPKVSGIDYAGLESELAKIAHAA